MRSISGAVIAGMAILGTLAGCADHIPLGAQEAGVTPAEWAAMTTGQRMGWEALSGLKGGAQGMAAATANNSWQQPQQQYIPPDYGHIVPAAPPPPSAPGGTCYNYGNGMITCY